MNKQWMIRVSWRLYFFCIGVGVLLLCVAVSKSSRSGVFRPAGKLALPSRHAEVSPPLSQAHRGLLAIRAFEQYMDSLRRDSAGRSTYDSILSARPGILDSARKAEEFFYLHDH